MFRSIYCLIYEWRRWKRINGDGVNSEENGRKTCSAEISCPIMVRQKEIEDEGDDDDDDDDGKFDIEARILSYSLSLTKKANHSLE